VQKLAGRKKRHLFFLTRHPPARYDSIRKSLGNPLSQPLPEQVQEYERNNATAIIKMIEGGKGREGE